MVGRLKLILPNHRCLPFMPKDLIEVFEMDELEEVYTLKQKLAKGGRLMSRNSKA